MYAESQGDYYMNKDNDVRAVAGITSALSALGSILIILLYLCIPDLRTTARYILVHLSVADLGTALSNLVGEVATFDHYYNLSTHNFTNCAIEKFCIAQAYFAVYFTLSSCLWTLALAFYMYILIMGKKRMTFTRLYLWFSYLFCYGMPLLVGVWLVISKRLGYAPYNSAGWCTIISYKSSHMMERVPSYHEMNESGGHLPVHVDRYTTFFGYDLWILLTCVLILAIYASVHSYIRLELSSLKDVSNTASTTGYWDAMHKIDYKFIAIPLVFILLRVWSIINNILLVYFSLSVNEIPHWVQNLLLYLTGIGDSGQGFLNAILFILFTRNVRVRLLAIFTCKSCRKDPLSSRNTMQRSHKHIQQKQQQKYNFMSKQAAVSSCTESSPLYADSSGSKRYHSVSTVTVDHSHPLGNTSASFSSSNAELSQ